MKQKFKSKIDLKLIVLIGGSFAFVIGIGFSIGHGWGMIGILSPAILFVVPAFFAISYTINETYLEIRSGLFYYRKIKIHDIQKISSSGSWESSPAASTDRLEIRYSKYDSILISPKDKQNFIDALLNINPTIEVILTK